MLSSSQPLTQCIEHLDLFSLTPVLDVAAAHALLDVVFAFVDHATLLLCLYYCLCIKLPIHAYRYCHDFFLRIHFPANKIPN
jgi:hypothetical protein